MIEILLWSDLPNDHMTTSWLWEWAQALVAAGRGQRPFPLSSYSPQQDYDFQLGHGLRLSGLSLFKIWMSQIGIGLNCSVASIVGVAPAPGSDWSSLHRLQRQTDLAPFQTIPCGLVAPGRYVQASPLDYANSLD